MSTTAPITELLDVLTDWRGEAAVLRRRGDERTALVLEQCAEEAARVADEYTAWLTEEEARRRSGWSADVVRRHARKYLQTPHVTFEKRRYRLRACIVPRRAHYEMIEEDARRGVA